MRKEAFEAAARNLPEKGTVIPKSWQKKGQAGHTWYYNYMKRRPRASIKKAMPISAARAIMANDNTLKM